MTVVQNLVALAEQGIEENANGERPKTRRGIGQEG